MRSPGRATRPSALLQPLQKAEWLPSFLDEPSLAQTPMKILRDRGAPFDLEQFLRQPLFAHLATQSPDGARDSPCWFLWEDDALWIIGERGANTFLERIEVNPRVAVGVVDFDVHSGQVRHVGVRGTARIEPWDPERARRLLSRYLGDDVSKWDPERFQPNLRPRDDLVFVRVEPESMVVRDQSYRKPG